MTTKHEWTPDEEQKLAAWYADHKTAWIARQLGLEARQVYEKANRMGLRKSHAFLSSEASGRLRRDDHRGRLTRFQPGQAAWNKGTQFRPGGRCQETQFKKGHRGGRALEVYQPIGTERINKDGYLERKINDGMPLQKRWRAVHLLVWEAANGPLPAGHAVVFKDGDKTHIALDNLECITRAELMRRNTRHNLPKELSDLIALRAALNRRINARLRKAKDEQSDDR